MLNHPFLPISTPKLSDYTLKSGNTLSNTLKWTLEQRQAWLVFLAASFLVSVPVFIQAPLVRLFPEVSLGLSGDWFIVSLILMKHPKTRLWGDLLLGFSWSWLAGSIYWGWFRWEPLIHLPLEAIGIPFAIWCLWRGWGLVGTWFYLGSLVGTAITDIYFWITGLIPYWRKVMMVTPDEIAPILHQAIAQVHSLWGISWAIVLVNLLLALGFWGLQQLKWNRWAFAGAVLSTILVDSLFWIAAAIA